MKMWKALRAVFMHFMRPMAEHGLPTKIAEVRQNLKTYSSLVQQVFGAKLCNWNLHVINCR